MPSLHWIGKEKVINHHHDVPFRVLDQQYTFSVDPTGSSSAELTTDTPDNLIIHGDNLEALKALLPQYEGRVKCIYIDPPYNTGNEGWVYNDNVNDPKIKRWLGQVVGKESEDLSRHDKWLCMMYPRLVLLYKLLDKDGVIFVSIDDNEIQNLRPIMDEIFGSQNRIEQFIWKKSYGGGAKERYAVTVHEYVLLYAKDKESIKELTLPPDPDAESRYYKLKDEKLSIRGPFRVKPLEATKSMDRRENLVYPIPAPDGTEVWPKRQWWWSRERAYAAVDNKDLHFVKAKDGSWSISYKQYLRDDSGEERRSKPFSIIDGIYNQVGSAALREVFSDRSQSVFQYPKPTELVERLLSMIPLKPDAIILDSFAGSGTTAHAVQNLNRKDGGKRKFILVEMEDYAETITAERVRRVMASNSTPPPIGLQNVDNQTVIGNFAYYTLGERLFDESGNLNPVVSTDKIRQYIWFTETKGTTVPVQNDTNPHRWTDGPEPYRLGIYEGTAYYFCYDPEATTVLDYELLGSIQTQAEQYIIYADSCTLSDEYLQKKHIIFKKIPRDITRL